ncbi:MAG: Gfo/Idh/MocA family protein [Candidatus Rokuibacteriota bacterium]
MLRGALIGVGNVAVHGHVPGWRRRRDVAIVAATDTRPAQRAVLAAHLPGCRWHDSPAALLAEPGLDFVDICTPPSSHAPLIRAALERGLHVLCEKPLVGSPDELEPLARLAAAGGRVLHTVHNWHHAPIVRRTRELVRAGRIGRVTRVVWETLRTRPAATSGDGNGNWRLDPAVAGGGVLTDHGWHVFYIIQRWIGESPRTVSARLETRRHTGWPVEDTASVRLAFDHATAEILLTWAADARRNWAQLTGTEGTIELLDDTIVLRREGAEQRWPCPPALSDGSQHPEWFDAVTAEFVAAVVAPAPGGGNLAEASLCVAIEHGARASSRAGGRGVPVVEVAV